jgi:hypothetical protein
LEREKKKVFISPWLAIEMHSLQGAIKGLALVLGGVEVCMEGNMSKYLGYFWFFIYLKLSERELSTSPKVDWTILT